MDWLNDLLKQLGALSPGRQVALAVTAAGSLAFFLWIASGATAPDYRALYRGLDVDEASRVAELLRTERIDYKLDDGGTTVMVPAAVLYEARIRVAGSGFGGGDGFELFDRPSFGVTDFVHRVNFIRALQGELARTIEQLEPVSRARVQIVVPERRGVVAASERKPRAAVIARLHPGRVLEADQVNSIVHLVASGVESLDPSKVTVVDGQGRLLAPNGDEAGPGRLSVGGAPGFQQRVEQELSGRIESLLEKTVGMGGVIARVRADMDWTERETTEETFDPESQVARSEQRTTETSSDGAGEGGVPGVTANSPDLVAAGAAGPSGSSSERVDETLNYEISKTVSRSVTPMGRIERLTIAVLVADQGGTADSPEPVPWNEESLQTFSQLAKQAVGFDDERGDQITVTSAPFRIPAEEFEPEGFLTPELLLLIGNLLRVAAALVVLFLFARLVVKPIADSIGSAAGSAGGAATSLAAGGGAAASAAALGGGGAEAPGAIAEGGVTAALPESSQPIAPVRTDEGVTTIKNWLNQS